MKRLVAITALMCALALAAAGSASAELRTPPQTYRKRPRPVIVRESDRKPHIPFLIRQRRH